LTIENWDITSHSFVSKYHDTTGEDIAYS